MAVISSTDVDYLTFKDRLRSWLATGDRGLIDPEIMDLKQASDSTGYSNETLICRVGHEDVGQRRTDVFVVRLPPMGEGLFENYNMAWQFNLMDRLRRHGNFSTPSCRWLENDSSVLGRPFFVMDMVEGLIPPDAPQTYYAAGWVADATDEQRATLWWSTVESLAALSQVDWQAAGLDFIDWPDRNRSRTEQQIDFCDGMRIRGAQELPDIDIPVVREAGHWLRLNRPKNETAGIVWGDARPGNIIYRDFKPVAHLDWEWAIIGDPINDLSYFMMMDTYFRATNPSGVLPRQAGFGTEAETIERYAQMTGRPVDNFNYYWVLNAYKLYSLLPRFANMHVRHGLMSVEEASHHRTCPALTPFVMERLSRT